MKTAINYKGHEIKQNSEHRFFVNRFNDKYDRTVMFTSEDRAKAYIDKHLPRDIVPSVKKAMPKPTFVIRDCNYSLLSYFRHSWRYFLTKNLDDCIIVIKKSSVFVHIDSLYNVIFNDIEYMSEHPEICHLEMNAKARELLFRYKTHSYG